MPNVRLSSPMTNLLALRQMEMPFPQHLCQNHTHIYTTVWAKLGRLFIVSNRDSSSRTVAICSPSVRGTGCALCKNRFSVRREIAPWSPLTGWNCRQPSVVEAAMHYSALEWCDWKTATLGCMRFASRCRNRNVNGCACVARKSRLKSVPMHPRFFPLSKQCNERHQQGPGRPRFTFGS